MKKLLLLLVLVLCTLTGMSQVLKIYGGRNHDVYLGNLNTDKYDSNSIWNKYGTYGNKYNNNSIWNSYGTYGNEYNNESPFNTYASDPPVLVDDYGNFYGYFTANRYKSQRADFGLVETIIKYHKYISDDVSDWYDKIFN